MLNKSCLLDQLDTLTESQCWSSRKLRCPKSHNLLFGTYHGANYLASEMELRRNHSLAKLKRCPKTCFLQVKTNLICCRSISVDRRVSQGVPSVTTIFSVPRRKLLSLGNETKAQSVIGQAEKVSQDLLLASEGQLDPLPEHHCWSSRKLGCPRSYLPSL